MNEFQIPIDAIKFKKTNYPWNQLMLNHPWSVGYVSQLIELKAFKGKDEWENFYYEMGAYRSKKISKLDKNTQTALNNEELIRIDKSAVYKLPKKIIRLNELNGRTKKDLKKKGRILFNAVKGGVAGITEEECFKAVVYRVVGETWNGIVLRERNTISKMQNTFPELNFIKKSGEFDFTYAVDFMLYNNNMLICGVQIKPKSYTYNSPYLDRAKVANFKKNKRFSSEFNVPVFTVISSKKGEISDGSVLLKIRSLLK